MYRLLSQSKKRTLPASMHEPSLTRPSSPGPYIVINPWFTLCIDDDKIIPHHLVLHAELTRMKSDKVWALLSLYAIHVVYKGLQLMSRRHLANFFRSSRTRQGIFSAWSCKKSQVVWHNVSRVVNMGRHVAKSCDNFGGVGHVPSDHSSFRKSPERAHQASRIKSMGSFSANFGAVKTASKIC